MNKYGLFSKLKATSGNGDELSQILIKASSLLSDNVNCLIYIVSQNPLIQEEISIYEVWSTKEDHDNSLKDQEVRALIGKAMPILDGMPEKSDILEVLDGKGI